MIGLGAYRLMHRLRPRRSPRAERARRRLTGSGAGWVVIMVSLLASLPVAAPAGAQELAPTADLTVVAQDPWLQRSGRFTVQVKITTPVPGYRLIGVVGPARRDMAEVLAATPTDEDEGHGRFVERDLPAGTLTQAVALNVLAPDDDATRTDPAEETFTLEAGVYPLELQLVDPEGVAERRVFTHLPFLGGSSETEAIDRPVGLLVDLRVPPQRTADGRPRLDATTARRLDRQLDALASFGDVGLSLQINPETVSALVETRAGAGGGALSGLTQLASTPGRRSSEILGGTYVGFDQGAWLAGGFGDVLQAELDAGLATLKGEEFLTARRLVALDGAADEALLARCFDFGRDRVVLAQPPLRAAKGAHLGMAPRLVIELPRQVTLPAADTAVEPLPLSPALGALDAYRVIAALLADPILGRAGGAHIRLGPQVDLEGAFASTLLRLLAQPGPLRATTISQLFDEEQHFSEPASWSAPVPPVADDVRQRGQLLAAVSARLAGLRSMLDIPTAATSTVTTTAGGAGPAVSAVAPASTATSAPDGQATQDATPASAADTLADELEARLLLVPAAGLSAASASAVVNGVTNAVDTVTGAIVLPAAQNFRVTAHRSSLPFVLFHEGPRPLRVALRMSSPEVEFVGANPRVVVLQPGANDVEIPIRTRRSGEFDLIVEVLSPDGALSIGTVPMQVQSRAISGVGVLLSIGALAFLMVWWARNARRRARGRRRGRHQSRPPDSGQHRTSPAQPPSDASTRNQGHLDQNTSFISGPSHSDLLNPRSPSTPEAENDPLTDGAASPSRATVGGAAPAGPATASVLPEQRPGTP